jgi:hypothetical protein
MATTITVEGKVLGQRRPVFAPLALRLPPEWEPAIEEVRLRDLIERIVLEEVAAFATRQVEQRLLRVLTRSEIVTQAARGKVTMGGREFVQEIEPQAAIEAALQAFEDGLYYVFVDDVQQMALDDPVRLEPDSRVTFVRLVALAGG